MRASDTVDGFEATSAALSSCGVYSFTDHLSMPYACLVLLIVQPRYLYSALSSFGDTTNFWKIPCPALEASPMTMGSTAIHARLTLRTPVLISRTIAVRISTAPTT